MILTPEETEAIKQQAVKEYPNECCGVILVRGAERRLLPCRNVQDDFHAADPKRHPRTARTAFNIGKADQDQIEELQTRGFSLAVIYHSHIDVGAYFSETDKRMAMLGQDPKTRDPLYPEVTHVVMSAGAEGVDDIAAFRWDAVERDFLPIDLSPVDVGTVTPP